MKALSDTDFIDYLKCPGMWYARKTGKFQPTADLAKEYFKRCIAMDESFPQWQMENSRKLFFSSGGLRQEFQIAQSCVERLLMDPLIAGYYNNAESVEIDTLIHDVPFKFTIAGVDIMNATFAYAVLGPYRLSMKKQYIGRSGHPQWIHWILADEYPAIINFYLEGIRNELCLDCKPYLPVVQKDSLPDYMVYDCQEIAKSEEERVYWAILEMQAYIMGEHDPRNLKTCGICEYCKTTKQLSEPEILTYLI